MLTSSQIRQGFLDFFHEKKHTIVPSSSLMPDSPNLLFTNAGMNQFVPIFLGEKKADVSKWGGAIPGSDTRAADTQKCIRAGGKHNDLDDVGLDTYHHTFFEMLGNWSFGDYFKKEAIAWSWELIVERWKFPPQRVYATIYQPNQGDPAERDGDAWNFWAEKFRAAGLDPAVHIVNGNKKDNFWMMGETGPCGPCSELHIDLTPAGDTRGALVNKGTAECIEIWNLVFIQFNAQPSADSSTIAFAPLPACHVDTGMGFERVASIIQGTKGFTDFANAKISNYETDIFRPIFDELEKMSGHRYGGTLPGSQASRLTAVPDRRDACLPSEQEKVDVAFRVIADHIRTLSFAIADGIQPGNTDRNYVLRRILRRAVRYGRTLGFHEPFFYKLVAVLARTMGDVFPEIRAKQKHVEEVLKREEEMFNKTLDTGIELFTNVAETVTKTVDAFRYYPQAIQLYPQTVQETTQRIQEAIRVYPDIAHQIVSGVCHIPQTVQQMGPSWSDFAQQKQIPLQQAVDAMPQIYGAIQQSPYIATQVAEAAMVFPSGQAFKLYDTYGFPPDLTELMARERGLKVDAAGFEQYMEEQRARARAAQKKQVIELSEVETKTPTHFLGYDHDHTGADVQEVLSVKGRTVIITNNSVCYAEMGGQVGDTGEMTQGGNVWRIVNTQKSGATWLHFLEDTRPRVSGETAVPAVGQAGSLSALSGETPDFPLVGEHVTIELDRARRGAIQRHHTVTHLLHWALHEVVSREATQKGSFVGPDKLTFDFNSAALTPAQVRDIERLVNERIVDNAPVAWTEVPYADVRGRGDIMQFFGDKYGETVRVVEIGGYSKELCAGTHTRATGEIGLFRIASEAAIAAGVRRIEAQAGLNAYDLATADTARLHAIAALLGSPLADLEKRLESSLAQQKALEKALQAASQREAAGRAKDLLASATTINGTPAIIANLGTADGDTLQTVADALKSHGFTGVTVLGGCANGAVTLVASVSADFTAKVQAGKIIGAIAPLVGGKGGGKPEHARGGGKDPSKLDEALAQARALLG